MFKTFEINITGQVQGVGFRPYVFSLATCRNLVGTVSNNEEGVIIYLTGNEPEIRSFYHQLVNKPPPVAVIKKSKIHEISFKIFKIFKIIPSTKKGKLNLPLTPDFAICEDCKNDIENRNDRRFNYPFTTCVNCGPRWAITNTFPFERSNTNIVDFPMCIDCNAEYISPVNRRFHSQTNTCKTCGIEIFIKDNLGRKENIPIDLVFKKAAEFIKGGKIIAVKNTSGYLVCCDASNKTIVQALRFKKKRPNKPFAVLYPALDLLETHLQINKEQREAFQSTQSPIVIVPKKHFKGKLAISELAPNLNQLGIMLPYTGILKLLSEEMNMPIVATSGNLHGSPIICDTKKAFDILKNIVDYFLEHDLEIANPQDDSVVKFSAKFSHEVLFRRSRGYAPNYFGKKIKSADKIIAMGGHLKSTIAFLPNDYLYISQYLGNLDNYDVYIRFTETIEKFINLFEQKPNVVLIDAHPTYQSSEYGRELAIREHAKLHQIQHHKAHFASVLGEHDLFDDSDAILGVVWDGTGYGDDGQIWGGEFFSYQENIMERISHFEYFDWLAGDKMAKEPKLSLLSLTNSHMKNILEGKYKEEEMTIYQIIKNKNKIKTSSVGRLFDAVSSMLGICDINTYEGEAAILLENTVIHYELKNCKPYYTIENGKFISTHQLFKNIYIEFKNGVEKELIIVNFLFTLASIIIDFADQKKFKKIVCSGGVFQNTVLIDMLKEIAGDKFKLYFNRNLAPNDENISYGQLAYYLNCRN